jgi:hypothetical protein
MRVRGSAFHLASLEEGVFLMAQHFFWAISECVGDLISDHRVFTIFVGLIYMGLVRRIL